MKYKFYKADQFAPYWFSFGEVPQEALAFFDVLQRNEIPYVVRGGFALAALLDNSSCQIKDIDLIVGRDYMGDLIKIDFVNWEPFFNKNSKGEDVYSLFYDKGSDTYLKFDVLFMDLLPENEMVLKGHPIVSAEYLLLDKMSKVLEGEVRGYEDWKLKKNIHDLGLLINWFRGASRVETCKASTLSTIKRKLHPLLKNPQGNNWACHLTKLVGDGSQC